MCGVTRRYVSDTSLRIHGGVRIDALIISFQILLTHSCFLLGYYCFPFFSTSLFLSILSLHASCPSTRTTPTLLWICHPRGLKSLSRLQTRTPLAAFMLLIGRLNARFQVDRSRNTKRAIRIVSALGDSVRCFQMAATRLRSSVGTFFVKGISVRRVGDVRFC